MLRVLSVAAVSLLHLLSPQQPLSPPQPKPEQPVVNITPPCPVLPGVRDTSPPLTVPVRVTYDPSVAGATLRNTSPLTLELALNQSGWRDNRRSLPMHRRSDGLWEVTLPMEARWYFVLFYVRDEQGHVDQNAGRYWEVLACDSAGAPDRNAIDFQVESYTGRELAEGIHRDADIARAISILEEDLGRNPSRLGRLGDIWLYRAQQAGNTPSAYAQMSKEIDQFIADRGKELAAARMVAQFASNWRSKLPPATVARARRALADIDPKSPTLIQIDFDDAMATTDPQAKSELLSQFVQNYPGHPEVQPALAEQFRAMAMTLKDTAAAQRIFEAWRAHDPQAPDSYASYGRFLVQQEVQPPHAIELLTQAIRMCEPDATANRPRVGLTRTITVRCEAPDAQRPAAGIEKLRQESATLRFYRGRAYLLAGQPDSAVADLEVAATALSDNPLVLMALGKAFEAAGRKAPAYSTYLRAASLPQQEGRGPYDALLRVFVKGGMGTRQQLDARLQQEVAARRKQVAADFKPIPIDRAAPTFELTALGGKMYSNASLRGEPVVLTFWSTWCAPCLAEMPGFVELQRRNPRLAVITVAIGSPLADVRAIIKQRGWSSLTVALSDQAGRDFGATAVPRTCLLDNTGRLRFVHTGALQDVVTVIEKELAVLR